VRRSLVAETGHDRHAAEDYRQLSQLGIAVAREGIPWPHRGPGRQLRLFEHRPHIDAMNASKIIPIWDLCHYGYPDDLDPFSDAFVERFAQLLPRRRRIRRAEGARPAFLHAHQRDHLLFLLRRRMGLGRAVPLQPRRPDAPAAGAVPGRDRRA
jgi:hypothetical protein